MSMLHENDMQVIRVESLSKSYWMGATEVKVLKEINFDVPRGQIVSIIGPSGVGKSTLLNIIGTLDRPSAGRIFIEGIEIASVGDRELSSLRNRKIGFVFQFHHLLPEFTAQENVAMPGWIAGKNHEEMLARSAVLLEEVGLAQRLRHKPNELSGGEQQRVAVARSLINSPAVLLADEPTGNLDRENSEALHNLLWRLCREKQQTMILVTHNEKMTDGSDRIIELYDGKIKRDDSIDRQISSA